MIELNETHISTGIHAHVSGLKTASVEIRPDPGSYLGPDAYQVTTARSHERKRLLGSTRHSYFPSYNAAVEYALGYANRIAKEKREREAA